MSYFELTLWFLRVLCASAVIPGLNNDYVAGNSNSIRLLLRRTLMLSVRYSKKDEYSGLKTVTPRHEGSIRSQCIMNGA